MTTVDIEAIRERSHAMGAALALLAAAPNPGHAANAHQATIASATDVPLLLNEVERLRAELKAADLKNTRLVREVRDLRG